MAGAVARRWQKRAPAMKADHPLLEGIREVHARATERLSDETLDGMADQESKLCERIADMVFVLSNPTSRFYPKNDAEHAAKVRKLADMEERQQVMRECLMIHARQDPRWVCACGVRTVLYSGQCAKCANQAMREEK